MWSPCRGAILLNGNDGFTVLLNIEMIEDDCQNWQLKVYWQDIYNNIVVKSVPIYVHSLAKPKLLAH